MALPNVPSPLASPPLTSVADGQEALLPKLSPPLSSNDSTSSHKPILQPIVENVDFAQAYRSRQPSLSFSIPSTTRKSTLPPKVGRGSSGRIRPVSPSNCRYKHHISFDNFTDGTTTSNNVVSYTLNVKHKGHQFKRQSRTFMVGIDENDYSDTALNWLLEELVDDGDEIVCVTVMDKDDDIVNHKNMARKEYQKAAKDLMSRIQQKSEADQDRAIGITLEFAVGKLHSTILKMIQLYSPAMLIVGTRGRNLAGLQGLVTNVNSFSKWCLQYSPVPVIVVRPPEKRLKKKNKRGIDPTRQDYARILKDSGVDSHETRGGSRRNSVFETPFSPNVEARAVAEAVGIDVQTMEAEVDRKLYRLQQLDPTRAEHSPEHQTHDPTEEETESITPESEAGSDGDESSDESSDEAEFEVAAGNSLLRKLDTGGSLADEDKKQKLREMEVSEGAAWALTQSKSRERTSSLGSMDSKDGMTDGDEEDEQVGGDGDATPKP